MSRTKKQAWADAPPGAIPTIWECPLEHDHADSWYCDSGGIGTIHLNIIERDVRRLTAALEAFVQEAV